MEAAESKNEKIPSRPYKQSLMVTYENKKTALRRFFSFIEVRSGFEPL